jgi:hypothetical protein
MEITTFQRVTARTRTSALGLAGMGSTVPMYGPLTAVSAQPREHSDAGNGGVGALIAWGPPG